MMTQEKQNQSDPKAPTLSPLAQDKTYGEKKYDFIFGNLINFWLNLLASGAFAFWVKHSENNIKLPFTNRELEPLRITQDKYIGKLAEWSPFKFITRLKTPEQLHKRATAAITVFTLLIPGHIIMIPSLFFGERYKEAIVKHFDRKHYGEEALENPDLKARYQAIATQEKPTLLGLILGRFETAIVNVGIGSLIGSENNLINTAGKKMNFKPAQNFSGVDPIADKAGIAINHGLEQISPTKTAQINNYFTTHKINGGLDQLIRYTTTDVLYTLVSSAALAPLVRLSRKVLPGMTYKLKPKASYDESLPLMRIPTRTLASANETAAPQTTKESQEKPQPKLLTIGAHMPPVEQREPASQLG